MECVVADFEHSQGDLQLALRRIDDLHAALEDSVEYSDAESDDGRLASDCAVELNSSVCLVQYNFIMVWSANKIGDCWYRKNCKHG